MAAIRSAAQETLSWPQGLPSVRPVPDDPMMPLWLIVVLVVLVVGGLVAVVVWAVGSEATP